MLAGGDVLEGGFVRGMSAEFGCCSSSADPAVSTPRPLVCECEPDVQSNLVTIAVTEITTALLRIVFIAFGQS